MNAHDYAQWCDLAGLYLANVSHADRYKTYSNKLSPAGVTTIVVYDFLKDNTPTLDVSHWRTFSVYEPKAEMQRRIALTVTALQTVGATRLAIAVREARNQSPLAALQELDLSDPAALQEAMKEIKGLDLVNHLRESAAQAFPEMADQAGLPPQSTKSPVPSSEHESREQLELLLEKFVEQHAAELQADIDQHGDPRALPGFTVEGRRQELEEQRQREIAIKLQQEQIESFRELMTQIEQVSAKSEASSRRSAAPLRKLRRSFLDLLKENGKWKAEKLIPETEAMRQTAEAFMASHPAVFQRDDIGDATLTDRARTIGAFTSDIHDGQVELSWDDPKGIDSDWTSFSLLLIYPKKKKHLLSRLLEATERLQRRWKTVVEQWRQEVMTCFRDNYLGQMDDWELEDYEQDAAGEPTDASILEHISGATITLSAEDETGDDISCSTFFSVEWDDEHGYELEWEDEPDIAGINEVVEFTPGAIQLVNCGPTLKPEDLEAFETDFDLQLPSEYRQFLLQFNGGEPQPGHIIINQGFRQHGDIEQFLSMSVDESNPLSDSTLQGALQLGDDLRWPRSLMPIARVSVVTHDGGRAMTFLALRVAGKRPGQVVAFDPREVLSMLAQPRNRSAQNQFLDQMAEHAPAVAKSLNELFEKKLKRRPKVKLPKWLSLLREDDIAGFLNWAESGGSLTESFKHPELPTPWTVLDYLTREASVELLDALIERQLVRASQLTSSWRSHFRNHVERFETLMPLLDKSQWPYVLDSPKIWEHDTLLEKLAAAKVDVDVPINKEGATPLHQAVQADSKKAVQWLIAHGADPAKPDKFDRNAFLWAEHGSSSACLKMLQGKDVNAAPSRPASPDAAGIALLTDASAILPPGHGLQISIQMKSPPVTQVEKAYYPEECHYALSIDVCGDHVTYKDMHTPRQSYLHADGWPSTLFAPIVQWPELTPMWETLSVLELDETKALKNRNYQPEPRPDLLDAARSALEQAFDPLEAEARSIEVGR